MAKTLEGMNLETRIFFKGKGIKKYLTMSGSFPKFGPGARRGLENCYFLSMAKTLEGMNLEPEIEIFFKVGSTKYACEDATDSYLYIILNRA